MSEMKSVVWHDPTNSWKEIQEISVVTNNEEEPLALISWGVKECAVNLTFRDAQKLRDEILNAVAAHYIREQRHKESE